MALWIRIIIGLILGSLTGIGVVLFARHWDWDATYDIADHWRKDHDLADMPMGVFILAIILGIIVLALCMFLLPK